MPTLTSDKLVIDECLAPGLAAMVMRVEVPVLSNCTGELATLIDPDASWQEEAAATLFWVDPPFFLPMPPWLQHMPLICPMFLSVGNWDLVVIVAS